MGGYTQRFLTLCLTVLAFFMVCWSGCNRMNEADTAAMVQMVKDGHTPAAARCAVKGDPQEVCRNLSSAVIIDAAKK